MTASPGKREARLLLDEQIVDRQDSTKDKNDGVDDQTGQSRRTDRGKMGQVRDNEHEIVGEK